MVPVLPLPELLETDLPFEPVTLDAFRPVVLPGKKPAEAASALLPGVNTDLVAKSRALKWLRRKSGRRLM